jgi:lipoprotein Spr
MLKQLLPAIAVVLFLTSCASLKPLNFISSKQIASSSAETGSASNNQVRFIDNIAVTAKTESANTDVKQPGKETTVSSGPSMNEIMADKQDSKISGKLAVNRVSEVEVASKVQLKYAVLLNTEVETLPSKALLESVDDWYGVRYRVGGNTRKGVDCSGFTVAVYAAAYGISLARVSREQYRNSRRISMTELREGDLVFFDTRGRGGVSHVGIYLGNNKFIHASVSRGVMVNDLFEKYYIKKFVGAGRFDNKTEATALGSH